MQNWSNNLKFSSSYIYVRQFITTHSFLFSRIKKSNWGKICCKFPVRKYITQSLQNHSKMLIKALLIIFKSTIVLCHYCLVHSLLLKTSKKQKKIPSSIKKLLWIFIIWIWYAFVTTPYCTIMYLRSLNNKCLHPRRWVYSS